MNRLRKMLIVSAGASILASAAIAQPPGNFQMTPAIKAKFNAWQKWNDSHKNVRAVGQTVGAIAEMQRDQKTKFTKTQAKTIVGILKAWRHKPVMTDAQAQKVNKQLAATFTMAQLKKLATLQSRRGRGFGGGQGGPRPSGQGPQGGDQRRPGGGGQRFDPSKMPSPKEYNPLNPSTIPMERMRARSAARIDGLIKDLAAVK